MLNIRKYDPLHDESAVKELLVELLDFEKQVEPVWPSGAEIGEPYFQWLLQRCRTLTGQIFVAEEDGIILGFVAVMGNVIPKDPDEYHRAYAFISELVVHQPHRGRGVGYRLIAEAEKYARQCGVSSIRLEATAANTKARQFYRQRGYRELTVEYFKKLD